MGDFRNYTVNGIKMYKSEFNVGWINKYLGHEPKTLIEFGSYDCGDGVYYKQTYPNCSVYSIEACPERYKIVKNNGESFKIKTFNYAISDYDGQTIFYQVKDPNVLDDEKKYGSSGSINKRTDLYKNTFKHIEEQSPIEIECITLKSFCEKNNIKEIDFLHMDVEGVEYKAIKGLGKIRPKLIWMETYLGKKYYGENSHNPEDLINLMINLGYKIVEKTPADCLFRYKK